MRALGAPEEVIRKKLGDLEAEEDSSVVVLEVLKDDMDSVRVFQYCQPQMFAGMSSFVWTGIELKEILAGCLLLLVRRKNWPKVTEDVSFMGTLAARLNNQSSQSKRPGR